MLITDRPATHTQLHLAPHPLSHEISSSPYQTNMARIQDVEKAPIITTINPRSNSSISSLEHHPQGFHSPSHTSSFSSTTSTVCPQAPSADDDAVPDGGLLAWSQVLAGFFLSMVAWGYPAMFGVYQAYYTSVVLLPATEASWIGSVQTFLTVRAAFHTINPP